MKSWVSSFNYCASNSSNSVSAWQSIGPINVDQNNGWVSAIHVNPNDISQILIGSRIGGIFRTIDNGISWVCVTDNLPFPILGIKQIVADPNDPSYIIAVTGSQMDLFGLEHVQSNLLYSTNGGETWALLDNAFTNNEFDQVHFVFFHQSPNYNNYVFAVTKEDILVSYNNGMDWQYLNRPIDVDYTYSQFTELVVLEDEIYLTNIQRYGGKASFWKGSIVHPVGSNTIDYIDWGPDISGTFNIKKIISDDDPISSSGMSLTTTAIHYDTHYDHAVGAGGCPNHTSDQGMYAFIKTEGWQLEEINGVDHLTCLRSTIHDKEIFTYKLLLSSLTFNYSDDKKIDVDFDLPKGCQLKICWSDYYVGSETINPNYFGICDLNDLDYATLFQNVIYESGFYDVDLVNFSEIKSFILNDPTKFKINTAGYRILYFILEYNVDYDPNSTFKFKLNELDLFYDQKKPNFINLSNVVNNQFYIYANDESANSFSYFKQTYNSNIVRVYNGSTSGQVAGRFEKSELIQSINNPDVIYQAALPEPERNGSILFDNAGGHHPDYRTSTIVNVGGQDYIFWGNDGGVAYTPNALGPDPEIISLNGNLAINLIYNLDVHDKTNKVLIGMQDNSNGVYNSITNDWQMNLNGIGDGCMTLIQETYPDHYVIGDPQDPGSGALHDFPDDNYGIVENMNGIILEGETFLGMPLENYRNFPNKFVVGLNENTEFPYGKIILNKGVNQTIKKDVPGSKMIGAIGICESDTQVLFVADRVPNTNTSKLFKSTDEGDNWTILNPTITHQFGSNLLSEVLYWNFIGGIGVDPSDADLVYCGIEGIGKDPVGNIVNGHLRVIKSTDGGQSFADWSTGLPALPINKLLTIDSKSHLVFCATDAGVYYRMDGMDQWECFSTNLPMTRVTDLDYNYCTKELYCSTYGRGVWKTPVNLELEGNMEFLISQNTIWNTEQDLKSNLRIVSGNTLTIYEDVHIDSDRKIIIEPGARVIIDGATLTNDCGSYWKGIEVQGNASLAQNSLNQGHLIVRNNSIIEHAENAILVGREGDASKGGGIVQATNSTFKNNVNCIKYLPYNFYLLSGNESLNKCRFLNCEFLWDDNFIGTDVHAGFDMNHVNGVIITGCTFRDDRTTVSNPHDRPYGIISLDAGYKVLGRNTGPLNSPIHHNYDETNMDVSYFKNLREGIYAMNALSQNSITVDHAKFEDMIYGVHLSSVDNAILTRNKFNYTFSHPSDISTMHEMAVSKCTGYTVEGNIFNKQPANSLVEGALIYNSGFAANRIYRNVYENLYTSNYANGENTNDLSGGDQPIGLQFLCNNYSLSNKYDEYVYTFPNANGNGQGIRLKQGTSSEPAGNTFSLMNPGQGKAQIKSLDYDNIIYYHFDTPSETPTVLDGGIGIQEGNPENSCESNFNGVITPNGGILINSSTQLQLLSDLQSINSAYQQKSNELSVLLSTGNTQYLHDLVSNLSNSNKQTVKAELLNASPYLSEELLIELGEKTPSVFPPTWYKSILEANVEIVQNKTFINYLNNKPDPLAPGLVKNIIQYGITHSTIRGTKMDELTDLNTEKSVILNYLISSELSDSTEVNWVAYKEFIIQRDDIICRSQLADMYLGKREIVQCDSKLDDIDVHINEYMVDEVKQEMMDYSTFKKYILNIIDSSSLILNLTPEQITQLNFVADNFSGKSSVQAKNLLCYLTGQCEDLLVEYSEGNGNKMVNGLNSEEITATSTNLEIMPNPNNGEFEIKVPNDCAILNVIIYDIQGRKVEFSMGSLDGNKIKLEIKEPMSGIYLVSVECQGETLTSRIIVK